MPASPSLLIVPARFKTGKLYTQIATTSAGVVLGSSGDFNVTRATTATRFNSAGLIESVASGVPRLDYYTSGGTAGCPALLVEPSGTNLVLNSDNTATSWTLGGNTASGYVDVIGVSGNTITASASGSIASTVFVRRVLNTALASGSTYTVSFLMRQTGAHTIGGYWIGIVGVGDLGGGFDVSGSFSSGAIYSPAGAINRIRRVERWGTDVYRCSETFTLTASGTLDRILMGPLATVSSVVATVASGTQMSFAAPQIELGSVPTTFIPTTTAAVTRNADVVTLSGAVSGCIGQTEGTIYVEVDLRASASSSARRIVNMRVDGNNLLSLEISTAGTSVEFAAVSGGSSVGATASGITTGIYKIAVGYNSAASGTVLYVNGTLRDTKTIAIPNLSAAVLGLGVRGDGSAGTQFNDRIRSAALYTTRLTNAELAALTL
jgi:hypothetical protein